MLPAPPEAINGTTMPWEQVKTDGIDYFALYLIDEQGQKIQIMCEELAWPTLVFRKTTQQMPLRPRLVHSIHNKLLL